MKNQVQIESIADLLYLTDAIVTRGDAQDVARSLVEKGVKLVVDTNGNPMSIREIQDQAWTAGYTACREGQQPHSPYRAT